jgi:hypothetical protein
LIRNRVTEPVPSPARSRRRGHGPVAAVTGALAIMIGAVTPLAAYGAGSGTLSLAPGWSASAPVAGSLQDATGSAQFVVPAQRTVYLAVQFRAASSGEGYRAKARVTSDGTVSVGFSRVHAGAETVLLSAPTTIKVAAGQKLNLEGSVTGTNPVTLAVRAWLDGTTKPGWLQTSGDSSAARITAAGPVALWAFLSGTASGSASVAYANATAAATTSTPVAPSTPPPSGGKPSATTTGVPAGTTLTRHDGDITVTQSGTVLQNLDIHGFVNVKATNVTIKNSIVRGGKAAGYATGLITDYGYANLLIQNVDVVAEYPSVYFDGIKGNNFTASKVHVVGNVDSVKIHGDNVTVQSSLLENTVYYASDPYQNGGPTHNDNVQILQGKNLRLSGNTIRGATNFAVLAESTQNAVDVTVDGNWLDGGHCTVKLQVGSYPETAKVTNNVFGPDRAVSSCAFTAYPAVNLTASGNVFEADGSAVPVLRVVS